MRVSYYRKRKMRKTYNLMLGRQMAHLRHFVVNAVQYVSPERASATTLASAAFWRKFRSIGWVEQLAVESHAGVAFANWSYALNLYRQLQASGLAHILHPRGVTAPEQRRACYLIFSVWPYETRKPRPSRRKIR